MRNANAGRAARRNIVTRINAKLQAEHLFLVTRRQHAPGGGVYRTGRGLVSYVLAVGDPTTARYEVVDPRPVDVADTAFRWGVHLTDAELSALEAES